MTKTMKRVPTFPSCLLAGLLLILGMGSAGASQVTKEQALRQTVNLVILPNQERMTEACARLEEAAGRFVTMLNQKPAEGATADEITDRLFGQLETTQAACAEALLQCRAMMCYPAGPLLDLEYQSQFYFWPTRKSSIEQAVRTPSELTPDYVANLGATSKGLAVVENLLFHEDGDNRAVLSTYAGDLGKRRGEYLMALTTDLHRIATEVEAAWKEGTKDTFSEGGQESLNMLTNYIVYGVELITEGRLLSAIALHSSNLLTADRIEGAYSDTSLTGALKTLTTVHELYRAGIDDYLTTLGGSELHRRIEAQFAKCERSFTSLGQPLEQVVTTSRKRDVIKLYQECKDLELLLKVDLVSRLGVTLTFSMNDGD